MLNKSNISVVPVPNASLAVALSDVVELQIDICSSCATLAIGVKPATAPLHPVVVACIPQLPMAEAMVVLIAALKPKGCGGVLMFESATGKIKPSVKSDINALLPPGVKGVLIGVTGSNALSDESEAESGWMIEFAFVPTLEPVPALEQQQQRRQLPQLLAFVFVF
uniref:Uncharacterized protein n=1 Tax=Glossina palpalis gambiensis TaxID=67801 RepID=A0A1B0ANS5_9MUSC